MAKECRLSTDKLPLGGLPRNSMVRITDHPEMSFAVYPGCKASNQTNKTFWTSCLCRTCQFQLRNIFENRAAFMLAC